jgi:hypothetical protein
MLPKKCLSAKQILFPFFSIFLLSLIFSQQSCKKIDTDSVTIDKGNAVDKFLTVPAGTNPTVNRIINTIKLQEDKFHFLDKIIEKEGFAMWQNARIMAPVSSTNDILETGTPGPNNPTTNTTPTNDTIVLIPLVLENTTYVNSFISCNVNDTVGIRLYRGRDYSNHSFNKNADSLNAHKIALTCMNLEYETFQHNTFNIKDKRLLNYRPDAKEPSKTTITIKPPSITPPGWVTIFFTYEIEVNNENPFDVVCPVGQACQWTHTETVFDSYTTWIADFGNWDGASFPNDPWGGSGGYDPCGGTCTPVLDGWQYEPPLTDANGFLYTRIAELNTKLAENPFALEPCDSLNIMPLDPVNGYGTMYQRVAQFTPSQYVKDRIDSIKNVASTWMVDNFYTTNVNSASGDVVNCDFFPVRITQLPTGFTPESLLEYFRKNINQFVDSSLDVSFEAYDDNPNAATHFYDTARFNAFGVNSIGALIHIHMTNDGSVIESDYYNNNTPGSEKHRFTFTTMATPLDFSHPVAGNREFGVYRSTDPLHPNEFVFYTMGVDRTSDWVFDLGNSMLNGFAKADKLWNSVQKNMINFINKPSSGGQAQYYGPPASVKARPKWEDVKDYLKGLITWEILKQRLGC